MRWALLVGAVLVGLAPRAPAQQVVAGEPFDRPMVTLTFDDGWDTQHTLALPHLREHGFPAVFYVTTQAVEERWEGFMRLAHLEELRRDAHEVESHSVSHPDLTTLDATTVLAELQGAQNWLWEHLGDDTGWHMAAPFGRTTPAVLTAIRSLYQSHRTVQPGHNLRDGDVMQLASYDVHSQISPDEVRAWLTQAQEERAWIILTFHELVDGPPVRTTELDVKDFATILETIEELGLEVVPLREGVRQMKTRTCADCEPTREATSSNSQGDSNDGGCGATGPGSLWLLALLGLVRQRGRFLMLAGLLACGGTTEPPPTSGDDISPPPSDDDPGTDDDVITGPAGVTFIGRMDARVPEAPVLAWPGTAVRARFSGTEARVTLRELSLAWQEGGPSELDVRVDGAWQDKLVTEPGEHTYVLASGLTEGVHEVELYRRTEAQNGTTVFLGFDFGAGELLAPPARQASRVEIIGDSASSGFGVEGVGLGLDCPGPDWAARYQNFRKAWGARLGEALDAEIIGTVYSGKGIVRNIWRADTLTMPRLYARQNPLDPDSQATLDGTSPDAILLMMGGNDFAWGQPVDDGELDVSTFTSELVAFVTTLRALHPNAHIVLVVSSSTPVSQGERRVRDNIRAGMTAAYDEVHTSGDTRIHLFEPTPATLDELTGCNGHGTPEFHQRLADEVATFMWERAIF